MRVIIQRVGAASVLINDQCVRSIPQGLMILLGIENDDGQEDIDWIVSKILRMRIFSDDGGKMNLSVEDIGGSILLVSQFTLHASTRKGNRPSYIKAAKPDIALPLYKEVIQSLRDSGIHVETGEFGADMKVTLINDGPVTIYIDSKARE